MFLGFLGQTEYRIDNKGRIPIPPKYREYFREGLVIAQGLEKCLHLYPLSQWQKVKEEQAAFSTNRAKWRRANRYIFGTAFDTEMDGQGRISLPQPLREYAGIKDVVIVVGANQYVELWDKAEWQQEQELMALQAASILESSQEERQ